jgi:hypothetical protein
LWAQHEEEQDDNDDEDNDDEEEADKLLVERVLVVLERHSLSDKPHEQLVLMAVLEDLQVHNEPSPISKNDTKSKYDS